MSKDTPGWIARLGRYKEGRTSASRACEDMAARRVLRGLGTTASNISRLEGGLGIGYNNEASLWERTSLVVALTLPSIFGTHEVNPSAEFFLLPTDVGAREKWLDTRIDELTVQSPLRPVFLARKPDSSRITAYFSVHRDPGTGIACVGDLEPKYSVLCANTSNLLIVAQEAETFIKQFTESV